jgi:hypothetical protein
MNETMNTTCQKHHLDLGAGRISYTLCETPTTLVGTLETASDFPSRRDRRQALRWITKIHKPLEADPRPLTIVGWSKGRIVASGLESSGRIFFSEVAR